MSLFKYSNFFFLSLSIFIFCRFKVRWLKRKSVLHWDIPGCFGWGCTAETLEPLAYYQTVLSGILQPYTRLGTRLINYFPWMIPYSRRRFSDFFSLTQLKLPWKHHPSQGQSITHILSAPLPPPPPPRDQHYQSLMILFNHRLSHHSWLCVNSMMPDANLRPQTCKSLTITWKKN